MSASRWTCVPLEDLVDPSRPITYGIVLPGPDIPGGIPYVRVVDIRNGTVLSEQLRRTTKEIARSYVRSTIREGDLLVSIRGHVGRMALVPKSAHGANLTQDTARVAVLPTAEVKYIRRFIESSTARAWLDRHTKGVAVQGINLGDLRQLPVPLPPLPEQRRIADILDRAETLRAKRRAAIAQLDELMQAVFVEMFGDPATNPKGWRIAGIDDLCDVIVDCVNRTAPVVEGPTPYKMIRTSNVRDGRIDLTDVRFVNAATFRQWNRRTTPRLGDVILTREAPVGEVGILDTDDEVFLGQRLMLYRVNPKVLVPEYLLYAFRGAFLQNQFNQAGSGTTVKHLPLPVCRNLQVPVPDLARQKEFALRVGKVEKLVSAYRRSSSEFEELFASLQRDAFSGEL